MSAVWVNGRANGRIDGRDRGLAYGDGLFESMRVRRRAIRFLDYHLDRLAEGCSRLRIRPLNRRLVRSELERAARGHADAVVKLILTRGSGGRGYRPSLRERPTRIVTLHPLPRAAGGETAACVRLCSTRLGMNPALAGLKTLNRLESVLARAEWADQRVWEGLMRDTDDNIVCGTMSNLFVRRGTLLMTPMLDRCGIAGVMRRWVLEQAGTLDVRPVERRMRLEDFSDSDEAFLTNAVRGVVSIAVLRHGRASKRFGDWRTANELRSRLERV